MEIGDLLPEDEKKEIFKEKFKPGQIFYLYCRFPNKSKNKYLLLLTISPQPFFFIINSEVNKFFYNKPDLWNTQVTLFKDDHDHLDHDSYISCDKVIKDFTYEEIEKQVMNDMSKIKDFINKETRDSVLNAVTSSKLISPNDKRIIMEGLSSINYE